MKKIIYMMDSDSKVANFQKKRKEADKWTINPPSNMMFLIENSTRIPFGKKQVMQKQLYIWPKKKRWKFKKYRRLYCTKWKVDYFGSVLYGR